MASVPSARSRVLRSDYERAEGLRRRLWRGGHASRIRIVYLCGSTRNRAELLVGQEAETLLGNLVMGPGVFSQSGQNASVEVFLETPRLVLRKFTSDDLQLLVDLDGDPGVKRFIDNGAPVDRREVAEDLDWWLGYYDRFDGLGFWAAEDAAGGEFVGWFHFRPGDGAGPLEPELGYRLRRAAWGRGLATEGSRALIDKGFTELAIERVYAQTMAVNTGSRRVMEKSGMRFVRTFETAWPIRIPGDEAGDVEYEITREDWEFRLND